MKISYFDAYIRERNTIENKRLEASELGFGLYTKFYSLPLKAREQPRKSAIHGLLGFSP